MAPLYNIKKAFYPSTIFIVVTVFTTLFVHAGSSNESDEASSLLRWKATVHSKIINNVILPSWTDFDLNNSNNFSARRMVSPCKWEGVSCNKNGNINQLDLSSFGLNGTLDHFSFSSFSNLEYFVLRFNNFSGIIPSDIKYLSKLVYLDFSNNQFSGIIPPGIGQIRTLVYLYLNGNHLNGSIPRGICRMKLLFILSLNNNSFYGSIPTCLGQLSYLSYIGLTDNKMYGSIPHELGNLSKLEVLYLDNNYLTGSIPRSFVNLKSLTGLDLSNNQLNGSIPSEIGNLTSLKLLDLQSNNLSGPIPESFGELRSLQSLALNSNNLSGPVPKVLGNLVSLSSLVLGENQLNGSMPNSFGNLHNLEILNVMNNQFSGPIPKRLRRLKLIQLEISYNSFSGRLPDEICNGGKLEKLIAINNNLTGRIPKSLYNCFNLTRVRFDGNQLTGDIEESFGVYPHLLYIGINDNKLYGKLSDNWSKCKNLTTIQMGGNHISGNIPSSLGKSFRLEELNLSSNDLVGEIPKEFGWMTRMGKLILSNNRLSGEVPPDLGSLIELSYLDLSMNKFNESIPSSLGNFSKLFYLNLSNNGFTNEIPVEIGKLVKLSVIDLSNNSLLGNIPPTLLGLSSLEKFNLSHNKLSGEIPNTIESMNVVPNIDLSFNQLEFHIPNSKVFMNVCIEALQGNKDLCGNVIGLKQCESERRKTHRNHKLALIISLPLLGALLLGGVMGIITFYCWRSKRMPSSQPVDEDEHGRDFFSISTFNGRKTYQEILKGTEEFNEAYCIGKGGSGSVYKLKLASGDIIAVKRLHSSSEVINYDDFLNEIRALTKIRHRNIVKLHGYCSHAQNSFLVYEYLQGGSLADILNDNAQNLDWTKRVNIIKGVAYALSYMHHDCSPPIVHRDISSKNILLDSEYEACVSDFGTSKILNRNSSNWSIVAGTFGYLAPELAYSMKVTEKCDVYSFGVLVLEVIKGEHPGNIITTLTSPSIQTIELRDLLDHRLPNLLPEMKKVLASMLILGIKCADTNPEIRPTMYEVSEKIKCVIHNMSSDSTPRNEESSNIDLDSNCHTPHRNGGTEVYSVYGIRDSRLHQT